MRPIEDLRHSRAIYVLIGIKVLKMFNLPLYCVTRTERGRITVMHCAHKFSKSKFFPYSTHNQYFMLP